ncbi:hypothetical protein MMC26_003195 [Xylographa opegraphella]|nr:hypothetical protein [Xylographa opegraphella]
MFSLDAPGGGTTATRNPRRRQRTSSDDSIALRQSPKRHKRSFLAADTFVPSNLLKPNGHLSVVHGGPISDGHPPKARKHRDVSVDTTSLVIRNRGSKRVERERRGSKQDECVVQTKNDNYIVMQDPNIPDLLRDILSRESWQSEISSNLGHAVATTYNQAIIWCYRHTSSIDVSRPLVIKFPQLTPKSVSPSHPLPLGMLVHDSGADEIALLVVMPLSGQVIYWESVKQAANAELVRQKQQALLGSIGGLLSGEIITKITEAEPDGFILTTNNGRIIHLAVRDPQGRPQISTQYMRNNATTGKGLLGSITSVFSASSWRRDIAAVHTGNLRGKFHRTCIVATAQGLLQVWELARHSVKTLLFEVDIRDEVFAVLQTSHIRTFTEDMKSDFQVLDFALFPEAEVITAKYPSQRLLVLICIKAGRVGNYNLVDLCIRNGSVEIDVVHPITCYSEGQQPAENWNSFRTQLLLPEPAQMAFVTFEKSIVLVSLARIEETPNSQIQIESHTLPDNFQEALHLRQNDHDYHVVSCCSEVFGTESGNATCIFLVHGFGMARITTLPLKEGQSTLERSTVTVKSKIEQAIFYGEMPYNLLDFDPGRSEFRIDETELEAAALEISHSIMSSSSPYIPTITPSMEHQLELRATALAELINYTSSWSLKSETRWQLLWSAEKMAAAITIWKTYDTQLSSRKQERGTMLLPELLDMIHENCKVENCPERGETDIVRHYLIHDVWRIELVIPWAEKAVEELYEEGIRDPATQLSLVNQAVDIQIRSMETVFTFRAANAEVYGLGRGLIDDGIYQGKYDSLPEPWTSILDTLVHVKKLVDLSRQMAINNADTPGSEDGGVDFEMVKKIAADNPRLVHICCQVYDERCRWLKAQPDAQTKAEGDALIRAYHQIRREIIVQIADLEMPNEGIKLAERYQDMQALADVIERSTTQAVERLAEPGLSESDELDYELQLQSNRQKMASYFTTYGSKWADVLYSNTIAHGAIEELFDNTGDYQRFLTLYLRGRPQYNKLAWINEVLAEHNYGKAADALMATQKQESSLWSKKIELSMGKLALLAAEEQKPKQVKADVAVKVIRRVDRRMEMIDIQDQIYAYIQPALVQALDEDARYKIAIEEFGLYATKAMPTLKTIFEQNIAKLVSCEALDAEDIIDMITLINDGSQHVDGKGFAYQRFFLALKTLTLTGLVKLDPSRHELHEKIIWRRCMLNDNWAELNQTETKDDAAVVRETGATALFQTLKAGFENGLFDVIQPIPPSAILSAGTTVASLRTSSRYTNKPDSTLKALAQDLEKEDRELAHAVESGRLELWWNGIVEAAKASAREDADRRGAEMAKMEVLKRKVAKRVLGDGQAEEVYTNGHVHGDVLVDEQGDVQMD